MFLAEDGDLVPWSGFGFHRPIWRGTEEQKYKYRMETFKAVVFILAMLTPLVVGTYVTLYISCYRNHGVALIGNMFGAGNGGYGNDF